MTAVDNVIQVQKDTEYDHRTDECDIPRRHISVDFIRLLPVKKRRSENRIDYDAPRRDIRKDTKE